MNVAIYSGSISATTFINQLVDGLSRRGVCIFLFGNDNRRNNQHASNIYVFPTPSGKFSRILFVIFNCGLLLLMAPKRFITLWRHINELEGNHFTCWCKYLPVVLHLPDIFHVQWAKAANEWVFLKDLFGVRLILSFRGAHINYSPICDEKLALSYMQSFPKYDGFHAVSKAISKVATKYGADFDKTRIIYPAVNMALFNSLSDYKPHQTLNILSVGRHHWKKGYCYALDALRLIKNKGIPFVYTIVASGDNEELLYQRHDLSLEKDVLFLEGMPQNKISELMAKSDLFLLPSVEEGIANVVLEAMAVGCPVISTNCGGMAEVIQDGYNGWLVPIRDSSALAEAIVAFLHINVEQRNTIRHNAYHTVSESHALEKQVLEMIDFYHEIENN